MQAPKQVHRRGLFYGRERRAIAIGHSACACEARSLRHGLAHRAHPHEQHRAQQEQRKCADEAGPKLMQPF